MPRATYPDTKPMTESMNLSADQARLEQLADAAVEISACLRALAKSSCNLVGEVLRTGGEFTEWEHYPPDDVRDHETHSQYYFHAHSPGHRTFYDYGHFHTFLRSGAFPEGADALVAPAPDAAPDPDPLCHLVGISMSREGLPVRLFTTNRWVTAEAWLPATAIIPMLDRFVVDLALPSWPLNRWISAMFVLFRRPIEELLIERDAAIARWRLSKPGVDAFEDRDLEITSSVEICLEQAIESVRKQVAAACDADAGR